MTKPEQQLAEEGKALASKMVGKTYLHPINGKVYTVSGWKSVNNGEGVIVQTREGSDFSLKVLELKNHLSQWQEIENPAEALATLPGEALKPTSLVPLTTQHVNQELGPIDQATNLMLAQMKKLADAPTDKNVRDAALAVNDLGKTVIAGQVAKVNALRVVTDMLRTNR